MRPFKFVALLSISPLSPLPLPKTASRLIPKLIKLISVCPAALALAFSGPALAEDITWDGSGMVPVYNTVDVIGYGVGTVPAFMPSGHSNNKVRVLADLNGYLLGGNALQPGPSGLVTADNNLVEISDCEITNAPFSPSAVYGAYAYNNAAELVAARDNSVRVSRGITQHTVTGGYVYAVNGSVLASGNTVYSKDSEHYRAVTGGEVNNYGGSGVSIAATGNAVYSEDSDFYDALAGGVSINGTVAGNQSLSANNALRLQGGSYGEVTGGTAMNLASGSNNVSLALDNAVYSENAVHGAYSYGGLAMAYEGTAIASGNTFESENSSYSAPLYGGYSMSIYPGTALSSGNTVSLRGGLYSAGAPVAGGFAQSVVSSQAVAQGNSLRSEGGNHSAEIFGGMSESANGPSAAYDNTLILSNSLSSNTVYGGRALAPNDEAEATGNSARLSDSLVSMDAYGGWAGSSNALAADNALLMENSRVNGHVVGGYSSSSGAAAATGNNVALAGQNAVGGRLYGGFVGLSFGAPTAGAEAFAGNSLHVYTPPPAGISVGGDLANFEFYAFTFSQGAAQGAVALNVAGTARLNDSQGGAAGRGSVIESVDVLPGGAALPVGHSLTLIQAGALDVTDFNQSSAGGAQGATLLYDWDLYQVGQSLIATVRSVIVKPQYKAFSEGRAAAAALGLQGADLAAGQGMSEAAARAQSAQKLIAFSAVNGGKSRYNTGSHVDMSSVSLLAGLAYGKNTELGGLTLGAFIEYGNGAYSAYNSFSNAASIHGDGDIEYYGYGLLARLDCPETGPGHIYLELSARNGRVRNEYSADELRDNAGRPAQYDVSAAYYGLHLGGGYVAHLTNRSSLDLYGKYFWARQNGAQVDLPSGDTVKFADADSRRLRLGGRLSHALTENISPYLGAAYEREFAGKVRASSYGHGIDAPSLRGNTGLGEFGLSLRPVKQLSFDAGVQGYVGKRQGATGSLQLKWEF